MPESAKPKSIDREEWDFARSKPRKGAAVDEQSPEMQSNYAGCPKEEAEFCFQYEFTRTCGIKTAKSKLLSSCPVSTRFFTSLSDYFPQTPWLKIPASVRTKVVKAFAGYFLDSPAVFRCDARNFQEAAEMEDVFGVGPGGVMHFTAIPFVIAWHRSNGEILSSFKKWLKDNAPPENKDCKIKFAGKDARAAMETAMKRLGAYRLSPAGSLEAVQAYTKKVCGTPLYTKRTWKQNAQKARMTLEAWLDPIGSFLNQNKTFCAELKAGLSPKNRCEMGGASLRDWLTATITPWGARRLLVMKPGSIKKRLKLVTRYGGEAEPKRILKSLHSKVLRIGLDAKGRPRK